MQVATLFRESTSLLGASSMETGGGGVSGGGGGGLPPDAAGMPPGLGPAAPMVYDYNHPVTFSNNKYKLNMKLEPQDDGYETSGDMILPNTAMNHEVKCDKMDDPYSFIDDDPMPMLQAAAQHHQQQQQQQQQAQHHQQQQQQQQHHPHHQPPPSQQQPQQHPQHPHHPQQPPPQHQQPPQQQVPPPMSCMSQMPQQMHPMLPGPKKRGRKKKIKPEDAEFNQDLSAVSAINGGIPRPIKERKKHDRFNGMPEEEVSKRTLPDHLTPNLDIIIIGINPGLFAAYKGHHYAGPGNHFWKCLYLSGLTPQQMCADEDYKLLQVGIGFTNMVARATKGSADLTRKEIKEGSQILLDKLRKFKPKIAVFNGKLIYEVFSGKKDFKFGRQPDVIEGTNTYMWVMPSSSARCAQLPRAADKVPFYAALKKFRDYLNGAVSQIDESEMVFSEPRVKSCYEAEPKGDAYPGDLTDINGAVIKNEDGSIVPCKKKRGRPKKIKLNGEEALPSKPAAARKPASMSDGNCDFPKKKRGRPKKVKVEDLDAALDTNTSATNLSKCFSSPSPIQSPNSFYHMAPALTPPNSASNLYPPQHPPASYCQSPRQQYSQSPRPPFVGGGSSQSPRPASQYNQSPRPPFSQSPRPHSQPFTHSDLSSEISAAISSEQLGSPASPSLGPPDFDPPTSMTEEAECRLGGSPAPSTNGEHQAPPPQQPQHYPAYHPYALDSPVVDQQHAHNQQQQQQHNPHATQAQHYPSPRQPQDMASKSLSGLESLVDQIPSITDGDAALSEQVDQYSNQFAANYSHRGASPVPYNYSSGSGYPLYPTPTWSSPYEPVPLTAYPQLPYAQSYPAGLHVPSANYPYYSYPQPAHPPGYPPYLGGF